MSLKKLLLAVGIAAGLALTPVTGATPTHAAPAPAQVHPWLQPAEADQAQLSAAADYLVGQLVQGSYIATDWSPDGDVSTTAEVAVALSVAGPDYNAANAKVVDWLAGKAAAFATTPGRAAKLVLAAEAAGRDPGNFGGVDLIAIITAQAPSLADDAFSSALAILALDAAGVPVPETVIAPLLAVQQADGGFKSWSGATGSDPDTAALAVQALFARQADHQTAYDRAVAYLEGSINASGYAATYSPSNTAGLAIPALRLAGSDTLPLAEAWLATQQRDDGGFPAGLDGDASDVFATAQALYGLAVVPLSEVSLPVRASTKPSPTTQTTEPTDTTDGQANPEAAAAGSASPKPSTRPFALPDTGADRPLGWLILAGATAAGGAAVAGARGRK